ncbi:MAG: ABC transporter ATP-binding protein [Candidatus Pacebacteria bacterium]|nr:ABC transporter ATP-binding protein [Candidatus Paceibacterota bacterium]
MIAEEKKPGLVSILKPYKGLVFLLVILTILPSALNLVVPKIISNAIDDFAQGGFVLRTVVIEFSVVAILIFILTYLQSVAQVYAAERVARDLRTKVAAKISRQDYSFIDRATPAKLLTNLTSDVDAVKSFIAQAISSIVSSVFLIIGASVLLLMTDWRLALAVLAVVPFIGATFYFVLAKVRKLFLRAQAAIDWLNKVINESILGSALIRLVNSQAQEYGKFTKANVEARDISLDILSLFAALVPVITFLTNVATLIIVVLGGHFIIAGSLSLGGFTAFNNYLAILIFPILILGFMSNVIAQADASYARIADVLVSPDAKDGGTRKAALTGAISFRNVTLQKGEKPILKDVSFEAKPGTRTAIIGPTAAGKTQLLYVLTGLARPDAGAVRYDGVDIGEYDKQSLYSQIGFVFQDSILFNLTLRENIAFSNTVSDEGLKRAIDTAELGDFVDALPDRLDTVVSERGTSLSGGQKQRVMLARALALEPKILLLDDFTARVDVRTERKILKNVRDNYPGLTLISVTQKIVSVEDYDQIVLLEDGEIIARGTHAELMKNSPEYVQIFDSQESTEHL